MLGQVRNVSTREYHIYITLISRDLPIHKEEVERSIADQFGVLTSCWEPLELQLVSINGKRDFVFKDLFHQIPCQ